MVIHTVYEDYFATGEGRTISLWIGFAENPTEALKRFSSEVPNGDYFARGARVVPGADFLNSAAKLLVTSEVKAQLMDERCNRSFSAQMHLNYS
jgi:hypothetical protein